MQPLIDGDVLVYEVAAVGQYVDEKDGETIRLRPWDWVVETLEFKIEDICKAAGGTEKPLIYLTGDDLLWKMKRRVRPSLGDFEPNFRIERAKLRVYKGTRKSVKPEYYHAIRAYLITVHNAFVSRGCEADDEISMEQTLRPDSTIICTRDKDLRQVPGNHYGWESGLQPEFHPQSYDRLGSISLHRGKSSTKISGGGFLFFASQLLTGDVVDNIAGLPKYGPVKTFDILGDCESTGDALARVQQEYRNVYPIDWKDQLREQCDLLWMIRERNEDGSLKWFNPKEYS